jgi:hypothetical protein
VDKQHDLPARQLSVCAQGSLFTQSERYRHLTDPLVRLAPTVGCDLAPSRNTDHNGATLNSKGRRPVGETERSAVDIKQLQQQLLQWIKEDAGLDADVVVTGAVIVFSTEQMRDDGAVDYRDGRAYPLSEISPTVERGLIWNAAERLRTGR